MATTTVNVPFPTNIDFDGIGGQPAVCAVQPIGASVTQTGEIRVSGNVYASNVVSGNVQVGTLGTADADAENWIQQAAAAKTPLVIQFKSSPTDNGFELQDSSGNVLWALSPLGHSLPLAGSSMTDATLLSSTALVDLNTATATSLFTCPTGKSCVVTRVRVRLASTSLTTASISFGWNSTSFNDVIADATHTELTGNTLYTDLVPKAGAKVGTSTGVFKVIANTQQGSAATCTIDMFGSLF